MTFGGFVDEFSNSPIQVSYPSNLTITDSDFVSNLGNIELEWAGINPNTPYPFSQQIIITSSTNNNNKITLPNATQASISQSVIFVNQAAPAEPGSNNIVSVFDFAGNSLFSLEVNTTPTSNLPNWYCFLVDNSTPGGTWVYYPQSGSAGSGGATAAQLVGNGYGLAAVQEPLPPPNSLIIGSNNRVISATVPYNVSAKDRGHILLFTGGAGSVLLPATSSTGAIGNGFPITIINQGAGVLSVFAAPNQTINNSPTNVTPFFISPTQTGTITANGLDGSSGGWYTTGFSQVPGTGTTIAVVPVTQDTPYVVPSRFYSADIQKFVDNAGGSTPSTAIMLYPQLVNTYILWNATSATTITVGINNNSESFVNNQYDLNPGDLITVFTAASLAPQAVGVTDMYPQNMSFIADLGNEQNPSYAFSPIQSTQGKITPVGTGFYASFEQNTSPYFSTIHVTSDQNDVFLFSHKNGNYSKSEMVASDYLAGPQVNVDSPQQAVAGSPEAPNYSFSGVDTGSNLVSDTGMYLAAVGSGSTEHALGFSAGGTECIQMTSSGIQLLVPFIFTDPLLGPSGNAGNPTYSFAGLDSSSNRLSDTGIYLSSGLGTTHTLGLAAGGSTPMTLTATSIGILNNSQTSNLLNIFNSAGSIGTLNIGASNAPTSIVQIYGTLTNSGNANLGTTSGSSVSLANAGGTVNIFDATGATGTLTIGTSGTPTSIVQIYGTLTTTGNTTLGNLSGATIALAPNGGLLRIFNGSTTAVGNVVIGNTGTSTPVSVYGKYQILNSSNIEIAELGLQGVQTPIGNATAPTHTFFSASSTGMFLKSASPLTLGFSVNTTDIMDITSSLVTINGGLNVTGNIDLSGPLLLATGNVANPAYSFDSPNNTSGMFFDAITGFVGISYTGSQTLGINADVNIYRGQILGPFGSVSNPLYSFTDSDASGMWSSSDGLTLNFSVGAGLQALGLNSTAATFSYPVSIPFGSLDIPGLNFQGGVQGIHSGIRFTESGTNPNHVDTMILSVSNDVNIIDFITMQTQYVGTSPSGASSSTMSIFNSDNCRLNIAYNTGVNSSVYMLTQGGIFQVGAGTGSGSGGLAIIFGEQNGNGENMTIYTTLDTYETVTMHQPLGLASGGSATDTTSPYWNSATPGYVLTASTAGAPPTWKPGSNAINIQSLVTNKNQTLQVVAPFPTPYNVIDFGGGSDNFAVSITPSNTSSKVLVTVCANFYAETSTILEVSLARNGTIISDTTTSQDTPTGNASFRLIGNESEEENLYLWSLTYLDSPASNTSVTYSLQWRAANASGDAKAWINITDPTNATHANGISSITAMEIPG